MLNKIKKWSGLLVVGFFVICLSGCAALIVGAAVGASGIAYIKGTLEQNVDRPVAQAHKASVAALKSLKIAVKEEKLEQHDGHIKGEYVDGTKLTIDTKALTEKSSTISIRIGVFGEKEKSELIMNTITKRL